MPSRASAGTLVADGHSASIPFEPYPYREPMFQTVRGLRQRRKRPIPQRRAAPECLGVLNLGPAWGFLAIETTTTLSPPCLQSFATPGRSLPPIFSPQIDLI